MVTILFMVSVISLLWGSSTCACSIFKGCTNYHPQQLASFDSTLSALEVTADDVLNLFSFVGHHIWAYNIDECLPNRNQKQRNLYIKQSEEELLTPTRICEYFAYVKDPWAYRSKDSSTRVVEIKDKPLRIQIGSVISAFVAMILYDPSNDSSSIVDLETMEIRARLLFGLIYEKVRLTNMTYKWADRLEKEVRLSKNKNLKPEGIIKDSLVPILMRISNEFLKEADDEDFKSSMGWFSNFGEIHYVWSSIVRRFSGPTDRFCLVKGEWQKKSVEIDGERVLEQWIQFAMQMPDFIKIAPDLIKFANDLEHDKKTEDSCIKYIANFIEKQKPITDEIRRRRKREYMKIMRNSGMSESTSQLRDVYYLHIEHFF